MKVGIKIKITQEYAKIVRGSRSRQYRVTIASFHRMMHYCAKHGIVLNHGNGGSLTFRVL